MRWLRLGLVVTCAAGAACSLAVSLDGLQGGAAATDGGAVDAPGPASADAGVDRAEGGDGGAVDAMPDAAPSLCATLSPPPKLCVDFGKGRLHSTDSHVSDEMDGVQIISSPAPTLDPAHFASSAPAAAFDLAGSFSVLYRTYESSPPQVRFGASMRFEADALPNDTDLLELRLAGETAFVFLRAYGDGRVTVVHAYTAVDGGNGRDETILEKNLLAPRTWFRVEIVVRGTGQPSYDVLFDGVTVLSKIPMARDYAKAAPMRLLAGYTQVSASRGGALLVDDVILDY